MLSMRDSLQSSEERPFTRRIDSFENQLFAVGLPTYRISTCGGGWRRKKV